MGVSIEIWRARIGSFHGGRYVTAFSPGLPSLKSWLLAAFHFLVIVILLIIGNIELNPGPNNNSYGCPYCKFRASTTGEHIQHQRVHEMTFNFRFKCPLTTCNSTFESYASANAHVSNHSIPRNKATGLVSSMQCPYCDYRIASNKALCDHLKEAHLKSGTEVVCPLRGCSRTKPFSEAPHFSNHLSLYHPGWKSDFSTMAHLVPELDTEDGTRETPIPMDFEEMEEGGGSGGNVHGMTEDQIPVDLDEEMEEAGGSGGNVHIYPSDAGLGGAEGNDKDTSDDTESDSDSDGDITNLYGHDDIVMDIANTYAFMEGDRLVPSKTVDLIAKRFAFVSEALHNRFKLELRNELESEGLTGAAISRITTAVLSKDPLYNSHHKNATRVCLVSKHLRKKYYKKHFKYSKHSEINLNKNPKDREAVVHYVDIKETLALLLADKTVQREVEASFVRRQLPADETVYSDYTTGSIFRNGNNPVKAIDLMLFMDAFGCTNALGSTKTDEKYKILGVYMTLGNLKPQLRAYLRSMRLVLLCQDSLLKRSQDMFERCFKKLIRDLKHLETHGINFKGEIIPFRLQFVQGDNLGQHTIGGFVESFSASYFCRFCDLSKAQFHADRAQDKPVFRSGNWRTPASFAEDLNVKIQNDFETYRGVKRNSPLNQLQHFKVCEPRLTPCLAHDLFINGVVDVDLAAILNYFVQEDCFSYTKLSRIIKRFGHSGTDKRNRPAQLNQSGKKLGGHAVQNWTLLRLLPFYIGDKVNPRNKMWKLYLLLKKICEYICAPALSALQIEHLRRLQKKYMRKRRRLQNRCKPKFHFFLHYPDCFYKFGALIFHWTLGFEHRHQFFKRVARMCHNFVNLGFTLASKFQLYQAYLSYGDLFPLEPVVTGTQPLLVQNLEDSLQQLITESNFSASAITVKSLSISDIKYKTNQWLLLEKAPDNNDLIVGQIKLLISDRNECKAIVSKYRAELWPDFGIYKICTDVGKCIISFDNLVERTPQPVYQFEDELCFSLKHVLLHMM